MGVFSGDFYSRKLKMTTRVNVIFPEESNDVTPVVNGEPAVLYLLHGLSGNADEWLRFSKIEYYAKKYNLIVIFPEVQRSFYNNYPGGFRYFDYVADELPAICGKWFNLTGNRNRTFIAGESMGGYGAVRIGLSRPDRFSAVGSLSGVLDYTSFAEIVLDGGWSDDMLPSEITAIHGETGTPEREQDPLFLVRKMASDPNRPRLIQTCGTEDFLYENNQRFRMTAEEAGYGHTYIEGPGDHAWPYWDKAIQYVIRFFLGLDLSDFELF